MKNYMTVMRLLVKNMFKKNPDERKGLKIFTYISIGVLYVFLMFGAITSVVSLSPLLVEYEMLSEALTLLFTLATFIILILGITTVLTNLYFSRDSEFFMSLPVSSSTVYFAKMSMIYLGMSALEAAILLPCIIVMGAMTGMSAVFYIVGLIGVLLLPALPLMLASVIAMPLMYVVSLFKNKGAMTSVVTVLLFALVMGAYFFVMTNVSGGVSGDVPDMEQILLSVKDSLKTVADILLPLSAIARLATLTPVYGLSVGMSALVNAAIFLGFTLVLLALAFGVSSLAYKKAVLRMTEGTRSADSKKKHSFKSSGSALKALVLKEWRQTVRTPAFALNCLMVVVMLPLLVAVMNFSVFSQTEGAEGAEILTEIFGVMNIFIIMMMGVGLNYGAATCITREGEAFGFSKSLPVDCSVQLKAKRILYLIISYLAIGISLILAAFLSRDYITILLGAGFLIPYNYAYVNFAIYYDLNSPRLKWTTPREAVKRDVKGMVPFFINMGAGFLFMVFMMSSKLVPVAMPELASVFSVVYIVVWILFYIAAVVLAIVFDVMLKNNAARLYERIEI